jgi:polysaccharide biosynthesis protein PslH
MKVLYIVPYVPNRIRVRPYNLIRSITRRGHQVTVATLWSNNQEFEDSKQLGAECNAVFSLPLSTSRSYFNCISALPTENPLQSVYCWQPQLAATIRELIIQSNRQDRFDVIHVEHLRGVHYALDLKQYFSKANDLLPPVVWDSVDNISYLFQQSSHRSKNRISRWLTRFELNRTKKYEASVVSKFDHVLVTSQKDKDAFVSLVSSEKTSTPITVLPNGVDLDYFTPDLTLQREPSTLVISGKMSYHANVSMVLFFWESVMPRILAKKPDVQLWIVGKDPPREIVALNQFSGVTVTGTVQDIRPYLRKAAIAVAPITYGAGIQNKVLESMACSTPVVASPQAISALNLTVGENVLIASEPEDYLEIILALLENPLQRQKIGDAARVYVEQYHRWDSIAVQLEGVYHEVIHSKQ